MQDRVSQYPGRIKLTPVSGQENVYDMEWADGATVAGTALNKANLLTDATAALFGLGADAVPDDVFASIVSGTGLFVFGLYNLPSTTSPQRYQIELGFKARIVIAYTVANNSWAAIGNNDSVSSGVVPLILTNEYHSGNTYITDTGFQLYKLNTNAIKLCYIAIK